MSIIINEKYEFMANYARRVAASTTNPNIAKAHLELAARYDAKARDRRAFVSPPPAIGD